MANRIADLDVVALLCDLPEAGLERGQIGTVMLTHNDGGAFEVEFFIRPPSTPRSVVATVENANLLKLRDYNYSPEAASA